MPIYEYECNDCGAAFERLCRSPADEKVRCPACDSEKCRRRVSRVAAAAAKDGAGDACRIPTG